MDKPRSCYNASGATKRLYDFRDQARKAAKVNTRLKGERYQDYACEPCGGYHIGRTAREKKASY